MKFTILGGGSLGSIYGGLLANSGHDVTLVARGENYTAIKNDGLTVLTPNGILKPRLKVVENPKALTESDVAFVTVKARDTRKILEDSRHLFGGTVFVSFQNSAEKDAVLSEYVGDANTIGGVSIIGATLARPGVVEYTEEGKTWIGELPRGSSERVEKLANVLNEANLPTDLTENITAVKWVKLVQFCAYAGISSLTRLRWQQISQDGKLTEIYIRLVREGGTLMKAVGVEPENFRKLIPIKKIMELPDDVLIREYAERALAIPQVAPKVTVSMLQDVLRGKPLEVEETLGYLVRKAAELSVEVPTMETIYELVRGLEASYLKVSR